MTFLRRFSVVCLLSGIGALAAGGFARGAKVPNQESPAVGKGWGQPTALDILPASLTVTSGQEHHFKAEEVYSSGHRRAAHPEWLASQGGSITPEGKFTAPAVPGAYRIEASLDGLSASAQVSVVAPPDATITSVNAMRVPQNQSMLRSEDLASLPEYWKSILSWPSRERLSSLDVISEGTAVGGGGDSKLIDEAIDSSMMWLGTILNSEWVPRRSDIDVLALSSDVEGSDTVRFRYQVDGYIIQVASLHPTIWICIKPAGPGDTVKSLDQAQARQFAEKMIGRFVSPAGATMMERRDPLIAIGKGFFDRGVGPSPRSNWASLLGWWTDGNTMLIFTNKSTGDGKMPGEFPHWFTERSGQRMRRHKSQGS